eukprot:Skav212209  [mRNA]  locus=scaffold754:971310:972938:+ [translate_table: standard]
MQSFTHSAFDKSPYRFFFSKVLTASVFYISKQRKTKVLTASYLTESFPCFCFSKLICTWHQGNFFSIRLRSSGQEDGGRPTLCPSYDFYKFACEAANQTGLEVEQYLSNVARLQDGFIKSKEMVDRSDFLKALRDAMLSQKFTVILGGKNLGKTLIRNRTIRQLENEGANLTIIDVNMREHPSKELFTAILERVARKNSDWASNLLRILKKRAPDRAAAIASAVLMVTQDDVPALVRMLSHIEKEEILLDMMTTAFKGNATCIVIDEANLALPVTGSESIHSQRALQYFVMLSKEQGIASVVLISSELGYSFRLRECGMNLQDIQNIVVANEVPKKEMLKLMVNRWNMSIDLAEEFFTYCGGNIDLCCRGVDQLQRLGDQFDPCILADCPGLPSCASDPDAKKHLQNLAKQGFSPVYDVETDHAAKLIAEKNVGGIIPKRASAFNLPEGIWEGNHENALVPSGTLMTLKIANELERVNRMGARNLDAPLVNQSNPMQSFLTLRDLMYRDCTLHLVRMICAVQWHINLIERTISNCEVLPPRS